MQNIIGIKMNRKPVLYLINFFRRGEGKSVGNLHGERALKLRSLKDLKVTVENL
jgi:hypothetical protein